MLTSSLRALTRGLCLACVVTGVALAGTGPQQAKPQIPRDPRVVRQPQTAGRGVIAGVVVSVDAGRPIRRARVTISGGTPRITRSVQSDEQGAFGFADLPPGDYTLTSSKGGYVDTVFGQKQPGSGRPGTPVRLLADQQLTRIAMPLARGGAITGAVFDDAGEPAFAVSVRLYRWTMASGERRLESADSATTDDRGVYRFAVLRPGEYLISTAQDSFSDGVAHFKVMGSGDFFIESASVKRQIAVTFDSMENEANGAAPLTGFATVFYPGATDVSAAQSIPVTAGEERSGVDLHLQLVPIAHISGTVVGPDGPASGIEVQLIDRALPAGIGVRRTRVGNDGRFMFSGVAPGQYLLFARAAAKGKVLQVVPMDAGEPQAVADAVKKRVALAAATADAAQLWAMAEVPADGRDVNDAQLVLQPGMTVSGRVVFEGGSGPSPTPTRMFLSLAMVGHYLTGDEIESQTSVVDANGQFTIRGVIPGRYRLAVAAGVPSGYVMRSALFDGQDVLDVPFQLTGNEHPSGGLVTFTTRTAELSGAVLDAAGEPAPGVTVVAFAADERFWTPGSRRVQAVRPSSDGRYVLRNLPAGDYRLVAVVDVEPGQWFDPAFLRALSGFATLTVTDAGKVTQDIRLK